MRATDYPVNCSVLNEVSSFCRSELARLARGLMIVAICALGCGSTAAAPVQVVFAEKDFRKLATFTVAPKYPEDAIRSTRTGICIALVQISINATIISIQIIKAPSEAIAQEMRRALQQWKFKIARDQGGQPISFEGKLTYYFVHEKGQWKVFSSMDSFYVGPHFDQ
jgi:hypothetical protein